MKTKSLDKALTVITVLLCAFIAISGICLIASALHIYFSGGDTPYSPETVRSHLLLCLPALVITFLLAAAAFVLKCFALDKTKSEAVKYPKMILKTLYKNYGKEGKKLSLTEEEKAALTEGRKRIKIYRIASLAVCVIAAAVSLILALNSSSYTIEDVNGSVISILIVALPLAVVALSGLYVSQLFIDKLYEKELGLLLTAIKENSKRGEGEDFLGSPSVLSALKGKEKQILITVRVAVTALAVYFIILGIFNGGAGDVLGKAVRICTECIGLG